MPRAGGGRWLSMGCAFIGRRGPFHSTGSAPSRAIDLRPECSLTPPAGSDALDHLVPRCAPTDLSRAPPARPPRWIGTKAQCDVDRAHVVVLVRVPGVDAPHLRPALVHQAKVGDLQVHAQPVDTCCATCTSTTMPASAQRRSPSRTRSASQCAGRATCPRSGRRPWRRRARRRRPPVRRGTGRSS